MQVSGSVDVFFGFSFFHLELSRPFLIEFDHLGRVSRVPVIGSPSAIKLRHFQHEFFFQPFRPSTGLRLLA